MVNLNKMYDGVVNSPETYLTQNLAADATIIYVADSSVFGNLPNLAVIGTDQNAETILIKLKRSDGGLDVQRALEGPAKRWEKTTAIARNFTNFDYQQIKNNIEKLNTGKQESLTAGNNIQITNGRISATDTKYDDTEVKRDISNLKNSQLSKASQTEAESGVDNTKYMTPQTTKQAIEKLSPKQDLSGYAKETDIKNKLSEMEEDSNHRTVTDAEKSNWNNKVDKVSGKDLSSNDFTNNLKTKLEGLDVATSSKNGLMNSDWVKPLVENFAGVTNYKGDLNTLFKAGMYSCQNNTNRPSGAGNYGTCIVTKADNNTEPSNTDSIQMWIGQDDSLWIRNSIDKTDAWTNWKQAGDGVEKQSVKIGRKNSYDIYYNDDSLTLMKIGSLVSANGVITFKDNITWDYQIPQGFRQSQDNFSIGVVCFASNGDPHYVAILSSTSGDLRLLNNVMKKITVPVNICWYV